MASRLDELTQQGWINWKIRNMASILSAVTGAPPPKPDNCCRKMKKPGKPKWSRSVCRAYHGDTQDVKVPFDIQDGSGKIQLIFTGAFGE